jgi:hypothetical protein
MFENNSREEITYNNQTGQQFMHRASSSNPAVPEHVTDSILPPYNYDVSVIRPAWVLFCIS